MINILSILRTDKKILFILFLVLLILISAVFSNWEIAVGLMLILFLSIITFLVLFKIGVRDKEVYQLFLIAFLIHLFASLLIFYIIYYTSFRPVGGGADFDLYQNNAVEIANRFKLGNFSLKGMYTENYFSLFMGMIYVFTTPEMIIGQLFSVWPAVLSVLLVYFLVIEIGGSKKWAFLIGLVVSFYPSYLYFGSVPLKDILVIPLVLSGILLSVKMFKIFSAFKFLAFFAILTSVIHFRFYVGYALMFSFIICWFLISNLKVSERIIYGAAIIFLLGFSPQLLGYGYYGTTPLNIYLTKKYITELREIVYAPTPEIVYAPTPEKEVAIKNPRGTSAPTPDFYKEIPTKEENMASMPKETFIKGTGVNSSFVIKAGFENPFTFIKNYFLSFIYSLLGPFFWQVKVKRQLVALAEVIPWYFFFCLIFYGAYKSIKIYGFLQFLERYKYALPLLLFSMISLGALSLFINNFGIIIRIRIPAIIALLCIVSLEPSFINSLEKWIKTLKRSVV